MSDPIDTAIRILFVDYWPPGPNNTGSMQKTFTSLLEDYLQILPPQYDQINPKELANRIQQILQEHITT